LKVDSTLRGHIATDAVALCTAVGQKQGADTALCVLAPAWPGASVPRSTIGGLQLVGGSPVSNASTTDPTSPRSTSLVSALFEHIACTVANVPLDVVCRGTDAVLAALNAAVASAPAGVAGQVSVVVVIADATDDRHLETVARACARLSVRPVTAGSAGFLRPIVEAFEATAAAQDKADTDAGIASTSPLAMQAKEHQAAQPVALAAAAGRILVASGSLQPATSQQLDGVRNMFGDQLYEWDVSGGVEAPPAVTGDASIIVVRASSGPSPSEAEAARAVGAVTAAVMALVERDGIPDALVATGGWTLASVLRALACTAVRLDAELEPGVVAGVMLDGVAAGRRFVSKSGSLGTAGCLQKAIKALRAPSSLDRPILAVTMGDPCGIGELAPRYRRAWIALLATVDYVMRIRHLKQIHPGNPIANPSRVLQALRFAPRCSPTKI